MAMHNRGAAPIDLDTREGEPRFVGTDLSSTDELRTVVAVFADDDGGYTVYPQFFVPEDTLRRRQERDQVPYLTWADEGWLTPTPGNVVDYDMVEDAIMELAERFRVIEIPIDRWNSTGTQTRLLAEGLPVLRFGQGFASMSPAVKEVERAILARKLRHGGHPVLRWCFQNAVIDCDPADNCKFNKAKSAEKIGGAVASAMAVARAAAADTGPSVYETDRPNGFLFI